METLVILTISNSWDTFNLTTNYIRIVTNNYSYLMIFFCLNAKNVFLQSIIKLKRMVWISFIPANTISFYENE